MFKATQLSVSLTLSLLAMSSAYAATSGTLPDAIDAGYEPLAVVSFKRALILVLNQKATVLAGAEDRVRSAIAISLVIWSPAIGSTAV